MATTYSRTYKTTSSTSATSSVAMTASSKSEWKKSFSIFSAQSGDTTTPQGKLTQIVLRTKHTCSYYGNVSLRARIYFGSTYVQTTSSVTFSSSAPSQTATFTFSSSTLGNYTPADITKVSLQVTSSGSSGSFYWRIESGSINEITCTYEIGCNTVSIKKDGTKISSSTTVTIGDTLTFSDFLNIGSSALLDLCLGSATNKIVVSSTPASLSSYIVDFADVASLLDYTTTYSAFFRLTTTFEDETTAYVDYPFVLVSDSTKTPSFTNFSCGRSSSSTTYSQDVDGVNGWVFISSSKPATVDSDIFDDLPAGSKPTIDIKWTYIVNDVETTKGTTTYTFSSATKSISGDCVDTSLSTAYDYTITATLKCLGYAPIVLSAKWAKAFAALHITADGGGVAVGKYSTGSQSDKKFECEYPAYFDDDIQQNGKSLFWNAGDTLVINPNGTAVSGWVSSSTKALYLGIQVGKPIRATSVTASGYICVRTTLGYINSGDTGGFNVNGSAYTTNVTIKDAEAGWLMLHIVKSSAYTNATNNTPVVACGGSSTPLTLTFS